MKNAIKTRPTVAFIVKFIRRLSLSIRLHELRITATGQEQCLAIVRDAETLNRITLAHLNTLAEIDRLAAEHRRLQRGNGLTAWSAA